MTEPRILFIVGPTASGKTEAVIALSQLTPIEVISADSRQVYRGMSIGTAKPNAHDQALVHHHIVDIVDPDESFNLAEFLRIARATIESITARGQTPVVVGGTGQYVWGLWEGWRVPPVPPDHRLRSELENLAITNGSDALVEKLRSVDAEALDGIDPRNTRRIIRAIEVSVLSGLPFSARRSKATPAFRPVALGILPGRDSLYRSIDNRIDTMIKAGWIQEVRLLLKNGYGPELPSFAASGYREIAAYTEGQLSLEEAVARTKSSTHRLARSQGTWFKPSDPRIGWHDSVESLVPAALATLRS